MKIQAYIYALYYEHTRDFSYHIYSHPMRDEGEFILVETRDIEFDEPPKEVLLNKSVKAYRSEQQRIRAEAQSKVNKLEESIHAMLALDYKGTA